MLSQLALCSAPPLGGHLTLQLHECSTLSSSSSPLTALLYPQPASGRLCQDAQRGRCAGENGEGVYSN